MSSAETCSLVDCEAQFYALGLCKKHWERRRRNGHTDLLRDVSPPYVQPDCSVAGCANPSKTRGMCGMHAERARLGQPLEVPRQTAHGLSFEERYVAAPSGCWEWQAGLSTEGYGVYMRGYAHRHSYEAHVGPIPDGLHIDHLCRNKRCVNPQHLEAVEPRTNMLRGEASGARAIRLNRCHKGHEFTPENTYYRLDGTGRQCKKCSAIRKAERSRRVAS